MSERMHGPGGGAYIVLSFSYRFVVINVQFIEKEHNLFITQGNYSWRNVIYLEIKKLIITNVY